MFLADTFWPGYKDDKMTLGREKKAQNYREEAIYAQ